MEIHYKTWLDNDGKAFGQKCFRILQAVEEMGSLSKASASVDLTYCTTFNIVKNKRRTARIRPS